MPDSTTGPTVLASPASRVDTLRGSIEPRLWTPPLRELNPCTSYGFRLNEFAVSIGQPFDPWQEWLSIHIGELLPDGRPRFRTVLILVSRQNGKTRFLRVWTLWNLFVDMVIRGYEKPTLLGISSKLDYAKETWLDVVNSAAAVPMLAAAVPKGAARTSNGEVTLSTKYGTRYKIAANNEDAGRSLTIHRLMIDELRRLKNFIAWDAAEPTTSAVDSAQILLTSNQGDDTAVVLDALRLPALAHIENGQGDPSLGLFEWSSPQGSDPTHVPALLQANPNAGYRLPLEPLVNRGRRAKEHGGKLLAGFKTESMCMRVHNLDPAIDEQAWLDCGIPGTLDEYRSRIGLVLDVSLDLEHAILIAGAETEPGGPVRLEVVEAWEGPACIRAVKRELPALVRQVRPRAFGWFPQGPAAALLTDLRTPKHGRQPWRPASVAMVEITAETPGVCMGFSQLVLARDVLHSNDGVLDTHITAAQKLWIGARWVFARPAETPVNGAYGAAGAVHLARTLPPAVGKPRIILPRDDE